MTGEAVHEAPAEGSATAAEDPRTAFERRVGRFLALLAALRTGTDPELVHDLRVSSRRSQQSLEMLHPEPRNAEARELRRVLRRARRTLGVWRDSDVVLAIIGARLRRTRSARRRRAWRLVERVVRERRQREIRRARKRLARFETARLLAALREASAAPSRVAEAPLRLSILVARRGWRGALERARRTRSIEDLHAFRVATKRLRYGVEIAVEGGERRLEALAERLKELQEALGTWHDERVLDQTIADTVARSGALVEAPGTARLLVADLERRSREAARSRRRIFRLARSCDVALPRPERRR